MFQINAENVIEKSAVDFKGSIFLKNRHFFLIQERFNKLIYGINAIIKCGI